MAWAGLAGPWRAALAALLGGVAAVLVAWGFAQARAAVADDVQVPAWPVLGACLAASVLAWRWLPRTRTPLLAQAPGASDPLDLMLDAGPALLLRLPPAPGRRARWLPVWLPADPAAAAALRAAVFEDRCRLGAGPAAA